MKNKILAISLLFAFTIIYSRASTATYAISSYEPQQKKICKHYKNKYLRLGNSFISETKRLVRDKSKISDTYKNMKDSEFNSLWALYDKIQNAHDLANAACDSNLQPSLEDDIEGYKMLNKATKKYGGLGGWGRLASGNIILISQLTDMYLAESNDRKDKALFSDLETQNLNNDGRTYDAGVIGKEQAYGDLSREAQQCVWDVQSLEFEISDLAKKPTKKAYEKLVSKNLKMMEKCPEVIQPIAIPEQGEYSLTYNMKLLKEIRVKNKY